MPASAIEARLAAARPRLLAAVRPLPDATIRSHAAWGWVYSTLHGHYLDHLAVIEPWTDQLVARQTDGDPFVADPRAAGRGRLPGAGRHHRGPVRPAHPPAARSALDRATR